MGRSPTRLVPCGSCTACCRGEIIILHPEDGDRRARYLTHRVQNPATGRWADALQQRADGACVYLGDAGCTIHDRRPAICRSFDCRRFLDAAEQGRLPLATVLGNPIVLAAIACRQREAALAASSGERPGALPLTDPDAPAAVTAGVSAPEAAQSRHARSRPKPEPTHAQ